MYTSDEGFMNIGTKNIAGNCFAPVSGDFIGGTGLSLNMNTTNNTDESHDLYKILNENTFSLDTFNNENEKNKIEEWYEKIGQTVSIENMNIKITIKEMETLLEFTGKNIDIEKKNNINKHINFIKNFVTINKQASELKKLYKIEGDISSIKTIKFDKIDIESSFNIGTRTIPDHTLRCTPIIDCRISKETLDILPIMNEKKKSKLYPTMNDLVKCSGDFDIGGYDSDKNNQYSTFTKIQPKKKKEIFYIINHPYFQATFTIKNPDKEIIQLLQKKKQGFELYNKCEIIDNSIESIINKLFDGYMYDDDKELEKRLAALNTLCEGDEKELKNNTEFGLIKEFIESRYEITNKLDDKLKAKDILYMIEDYLIYSSKGFNKGNLSFRNKLSKYLLKMGLKKKRFSDGFYYYGLSKKNRFDNTKLNDKNILEQLMAERDKDINSGSDDNLDN
jgi:hypothetical protein